MHWHPTVAPPQTGVVPEQVTHEGPQLPAVLHVTQLVPVHLAPAPQEVASHTHWVPSQKVPLGHVTQEAPQAFDVLHVTQTLF